MIIRKIISIFLATTAIAASSYADNKETSIDNKDFYIRIDAGKSFAQKITDKAVGEVKYQSGKLKNNGVLNFGLGTYIDDNFRTEISFSQRNYKLNNNTYTIYGSETILKQDRSQKIKSTALILNGYYDFGTFSSITPYIQVGLGFARNKTNDLTINHLTNEVNTKDTYKGKTSNNLAWQIGAGASAAITESIKFDLGYKYIDLGKAKTNKGTSLDLDNSSTTQLNTAATAKLRAHEVTAGLRFDF